MIHPFSSAKGLLLSALLSTHIPLIAGYAIASVSPIQQSTITYGSTSAPHQLVTRGDNPTYHLPRQSMTSFTPEVGVEKPCMDCFIVAMRADLTYPDGTSANWDSGVWLHHFMQFNAAERDTICGNMAGDLFFTSGNERPEWRLNTLGPWGYHVAADAQWVNVVEIMNESDTDKDVQVSVQYEWIIASTAEGATYRNAQLLWNNIGSACGNGDVPLVEGLAKYDSDAWASPVAGRLLTAKSHVHDGGLNSTLYLNEREICVSEQSYGVGSGFVGPDGAAHVSGGSLCDDLGRIEVGDLLQYSVTYESSRALKHGGVYDDVMGVSFLYVGEE